MSTSPPTPGTSVTGRETLFSSRYDKVSKSKTLLGWGKWKHFLKKQLLEGMRLYIQGEEWKR